MFFSYISFSGSTISTDEKEEENFYSVKKEDENENF